jgi:drug/metabolite transporter (DMT)-like permease
MMANGMGKASTMSTTSLAVIGVLFVFAALRDLFWPGFLAPLKRTPPTWESLVIFLGLGVFFVALAVCSAVKASRRSGSNSSR